MNKTSKFSPEVRERAVRMVQEHRGGYCGGEKIRWGTFCVFRVRSTVTIHPVWGLRQARLASPGLEGVRKVGGLVRVQT